ncbi:DUF1036 domain-containing protein [Bacillus cereus]
MSLSFRNETGTRIFLAIAYWNGQCSGNKWRKEGWWEIGPRSSRTVYTGPTNNQRFYYFAINEDRSWAWPDIKTFYTDLPSFAFSRCLDEPGGERYGMGDFIAHADQYDNATMELYR